MARVAWGLRPLLHAAVHASDTLKVSRQALYEKVNPPSRRGGQWVRGCGERLTPVLERLMLQQPSWERRVIACGCWMGPPGGPPETTQTAAGFRGAALPGLSLGVYPPE